jgi:hypothetical protein
VAATAYNTAVSYDAALPYEDPRAATAVAGQIAPNFFPALFTGLVLAETAGDQPNGNKTLMSINDCIIAHNTGGSTYTITVSSSDDPAGRFADIVYPIAAGAIAFLGPFKHVGWQDPSDSNLYYFVSNAAVTVAVVSFRSP